MNFKLNCVVLLVLLISGCSKPETPFVGRWQLSADAFKTGDPQKDAALQQVAEQSTIEFKADKTGVLHALTATVPFTFTIEGKTATISITPLPGGQPTAGETHTYTLSEDGKSLTDAPSPGGQTLTYTRLGG